MKSKVTYDLVYEGASNSSLDTAWQIKLVFMTDLKLSVLEAKRVFDASPNVIRNSGSKADLEPLTGILRRAGADVRICQRHVEAVIEPVKKTPTAAKKAAPKAEPLSDNKDLNDFFDQLARSRAINTERIRVVDGVEKRESTGDRCRRDLQY